MSAGGLHDSLYSKRLGHFDEGVSVFVPSLSDEARLIARFQPFWAAEVTIRNATEQGFSIVESPWRTAWRLSLPD